MTNKYDKYHLHKPDQYPTMSVPPASSPASLPACTSPAPAALVRVKFEGAVLVCGECEKRSSGPKKLRGKQVRKELKVSLGAARHSLRIVQSSCLGLCPKKAIAMAAFMPGQSVVAAQARSADDAAAFAATLAGLRNGGSRAAVRS